MHHFSINDINGKLINENTINERRVKLIASPKSEAKRDDYGCGIAIIAPGKVHEEHAHEFSEELIHVVSGTGRAIVGGHEFLVKPDDIIAIDKNEPHQFFNTGDTELRLYWVYSPSGPEVRFLDD